MTASVLACYQCYGKNNQRIVSEMTPDVLASSCAIKIPGK